MAYQAEYIWLDGYQPTPLLRSKTKILHDEVTEPPIWGFDGSSTEQATGDKSDCVLKPVFHCPDPLRGGHNRLVMCEVMHVSGRPHFWLTTQAPIPRATPFGFESDRAAFVGHSHLVRPERYAEAWLAREDYAYELVTDEDLQQDPALLERYAALLVAGHSEYWSHEARDGVEAYLDAGGAVLSLSGDSCHWRVSFDEGGTILECRKDVDDYDPRWLSPERWGERWHSHDGCPGGCFRLIGRHAHEMLGLDPQGMIDDGTGTVFRPLQVLEPEHPLFQLPERVPLTDAGTIGERSLNGPKVSGYEFDAVRDSVATDAQPLPGLTLLASSHQPNLEWAGDDPHRGADLIYWERPAGGRVVSLGSIGATGALAVDEGIATLVRNVLAEFGVARDVR